MANMQNVMNAIHSEASELYQQRVPLATRDNIAEVGRAVMGFKETENEFLSALVNKIAMTIVHNKTFRNPLSILKKGSVPFGKNIEEIYTNPVTGTTFDPSGADLLTRAIPDTKAIYHAMNRQGKYKVTISKAQLITAFRSWNDLERLLDSIVNALYSGDNMEEFMLMKSLFSSAIAGKKIRTIDLDMNITDKASASAFVKAVKTVGQGMTFPSSAYNSYYEINKETDAKPVVTWTPLENQVLLLRNDISVNVDIELLAQAFNVSYAEMKQQTLLVDTFTDAPRCAGVLCDRAFVQVYDNLEQVENFHNGEGLYDNFILHHWQTYSLSLFANATAFMLPESV